MNKYKPAEPLTFLQPFSFPNFFSFFSKQQAPMLMSRGCGGTEPECCPVRVAVGVGLGVVQSNSKVPVVVVVCVCVPLVSLLCGCALTAA